MQNQSSETRLFVAKCDILIQIIRTNKYPARFWNLTKYERQMFHFNTIYRLKFSIPHGSQICKNLMGYDNQYDSVLECYILSQYLKYLTC